MMNLVKTLRSIARHECEDYGASPEDATEWIAADRIEELEAKLKIAAEALEYYTWDGFTTAMPAHEALTKIKGDV